MNMETEKDGELFGPELMKKIRERFYQLEEDREGRRRLFFENSGGSLRLKTAVEAKCCFEQIPDCPERVHDISMMLKQVKADGVRDIMEVVFGARSGALVTELTASQVMYRITRAIVENVPGSSVVTTSLEHPSSYDAAQFYAARTGKEFRVAMANPVTGGVDTEEILRHIDEDTCLLSVMSASNISGNIFDLEEIVRRARAIKPDLYIISDAVQHMPHAVLDAEKLQLDGMNFAPYKAFGIRGCGFGYVSERTARLPHDKLFEKEDMEWELGTFPHSNYAAMSAVVDYVCWIGRHFTESAVRREQYVCGMNRIHLQEQALLKHMLDGSEAIPGLRYIEGVTVYMDSPSCEGRDLICAIGIDGMDVKEAAAEYYRRGVTVFERVNTSPYSRRIVESLGLTGAIRVSPLHCHGLADIDEFLIITADMAAAVAGR